MAQRTTWRLFRTPGAAWEAMYEDCRRARRSIDFEQYIMADDEVGRRFVTLFRRKARQGVRVRVLLDMFGSLGLYRSLRLPAGDSADDDEPAVRFYNPVRPWRIARAFSWSRRDHRKIVVVDSEVGYTGGVCFDARMHSWRDTTVRVHGPVAREMACAFDRLWRGEEGSRARPDGGDDDGSTGDDPFRFVTNAPHPHRNHVYRELLGRLRAAKTCACLTTPYFVPNRAFFRAMLRAARRGVDVRLLLPENNDVPLIMRVSESYYGRLLRAGVRLFLFQGEVLHTKAAVIDDRWATLGSTNLDYLSFFGNHEANLIATEPRFVADMKRDFLADLEGAREVTPEEWRRSWHPGAAVIGRAGRLVRALL